MKKYIILIAVLFSCQSEPQWSGDEKTIFSEKETTEHNKNAIDPVSLNNGKKWIANEATTAGIQKMIALTNKLQSNSSLSDYYILRANLEVEFNNILQKCTMTGEAHKQLHNYLIPLKEMIDGLNSPNIEVCRSFFNKVRLHLNEYGGFFE